MAAHSWRPPSSVEWLMHANGEMARRSILCIDSRPCPWTMANEACKSAGTLNGRKGILAWGQIAPTKVTYFTLQATFRKSWKRQQIDVNKTKNMLITSANYATSASVFQYCEYEYAR